MSRGVPGSRDLNDLWAAIDELRARVAGGGGSSGGGTAFVQGGNSFGATAVLGTNDANNLNVVTGGVLRATFDQAGNLIPPGDNAGQIGTNAVRWALVRAAVVTSGDLILLDDEGEAHWTLKECNDAIFAFNAKNGKRYRFLMEETDDAPLPQAFARAVHGDHARRAAREVPEATALLGRHLQAATEALAAFRANPSVPAMEYVREITAHAGGALRIIMDHANRVPEHNEARRNAHAVYDAIASTSITARHELDTIVRAEMDTALRENAPSRGLLWREYVATLFPGDPLRAALEALTELHEAAMRAERERVDAEAARAREEHEQAEQAERLRREAEGIHHDESANAPSGASAPAQGESDGEGGVGGVGDERSGGDEPLLDEGVAGNGGADDGGESDSGAPA